MATDDQPQIMTKARWRFSLRTLLLLLVIVCLAIPLVLQSFELYRAEAELRQLRNQLGHLNVDDRGKVHVIALDTGEPNTWRWRIFLPKGFRYTWCLGYGDIPATGVPKPKWSSTSNEPYWDSQSEVVVNTKLRQMDDGNWSLSVSSIIAGKTDQMGGTKLTIPDEEMRWTRKVPSQESSTLGSRGTATVDPNGPIVLLQRRAREMGPAGRFERSAKPMPGYMIWLERG